jgi:4-hydroxy-3-methylbut-2-enyl diphosphate reductase
VQGDRLVGKETLVVLAGERKTAYFSAGILLILVLSLILGPLVGISSYFSWFMLLPAFVYGIYLKEGSEKRLREDPLFEALIESVLIGTGLAALIWNALS